MPFWVVLVKRQTYASGGLELAVIQLLGHPVCATQIVVNKKIVRCQSLIVQLVPFLVHYRMSSFHCRDEEYCSDSETICCLCGTKSRIFIVPIPELRSVLCTSLVALSSII